MKSLMFFTLLLPVSIFAQSVGNQIFKQDIAIQHTQKTGFTDERVTELNLKNNNPVANTEKSAFAWDGKNWNKTQNKITAKRLIPS